MISALTGKFADAIDADTSVNSSNVVVSNHDLGHVSLHWSGASHTDATMKLQRSNDGTNWVDVPSSSMTLGAAAGTDDIALDNIGFAFIRSVYVKGSNTSGSVSLLFVFKARS